LKESIDVKEQAKADKMRFMKKLIVFCFGYIIIFTVTMIIIYCIKGDYPETLVTVTFAYFGVEVVVSAGIKIFEDKKKKKQQNYYYEGEDEQ